MTTLLHISASPRGTGSESLALAEVFLDAYRDSHPHDRVVHWDLWDGTLPPFGPTEAGAKMAVFGGDEFDDAQATAWETVEAAFQRFDSAEKYLFSVPMWNHHVPYILKQFIDVVSQPGMAFSFDPEHGYTGLLRNKKATVVYTSGVYGSGRGPGFGSDYQAPYLDTWLRWAGIDDISAIEFRPDLVTAEPEADRRAAQARARELAKVF
ncbi:FMN-dependent NADH-azoreductase [Phytoactinopolyspora halotolerans]|uniref:FMN dependent NADH:quinone oxidoreductase n=1 Tax=Phytoactinopolyspora halotolerans TaxID=1981512 RepID=A0A6L9SC60_9ACTN|nr:NAD(P)H-dependent oxidoreductase [Phytoactinopolyspora halotolerans]NEE02955.1 flavodoxin family protein [Phytoactinopolyspora halotolerans]